MLQNVYDKHDEKAHSTILLSLSDEVLYEVAEEETAEKLWTKLEGLYMTKSLTNKLLLKQRLFALRMSEGGSLKEHLDQLNSILMDLKNLEVKIEDEDAALILLVSLPPSYENFVSSFTVGRETVTLEEVRAGLHSNELRKKASAGTSTSESSGVGLSAGHRDERGRSDKKGKGKWRGRSKSRGRGPNPKDICHRCKEPGHWQRDCPTLKGKNTAALAREDDGNVLCATECSMANAVAQNDAWIIDSGASFHMTPHLDWFDEYKEFAANAGVCYWRMIGHVKLSGSAQYESRCLMGLLEPSRVSDTFLN
jgi:hypothetical protein